ncbi:MAG: hypothetical protein V1866_05470 [archaeon]
MIENKCIDLVICGPDMSGTSTQIKDSIGYFQRIGMKVRDLTGTEIDALFHARIFREFNQNHISALEFIKDANVPTQIKNNFLMESYCLLRGIRRETDLFIASMVENSISTFVDPNSADVWILEEPTRRGSGQDNRAIEQNRSAYGSELHPVSAAFCHQNYRTGEFLRFRQVLRELGKIIIRSRSEESGCYQVYDERYLQSGISFIDYIKLPGHEIAFANPPTHMFVVCGREDWKPIDYLQMTNERIGGRALDDHENNVWYQLLVNRRYASSWINEFYKEGCGLYGAAPPEIIRFDITASKEQIKQQMGAKLDEIMWNRK